MASPIRGITISKFPTRLVGFAVFLLLFCSIAVNSEPLEGRVEVVEHGSEPHFPSEYLSAGAVKSDPLPDLLIGKWYGTVHIAQLETYERHQAGRLYWSQFLQEVHDRFKLNEKGTVVLEFKRNKDGQVVLTASSVFFKRGRLQLNSGKGQSLVSGGFNIQAPVVNNIRVRNNSIADQTRVDRVRIVDLSGEPIQRGYSEISAHYEVTAPRKMTFKMIEVDYDDDNRPLWKILVRGTATR